MPLPPRCWLLKLSTDIRLIYPSFVIVMTVFSFGIRSSIDMSNSSYPIDVLLSSPYLSRISIISFLTTPSNTLRSARIALYSSITFFNSAYSFSSFSLSRPVSARRRISTMEFACGSDRENLSISFSFASAAVFDALISCITSSMLSRAISSPSTICALSSALFKSYCVLLVTTSS